MNHQHFSSTFHELSEMSIAQIRLLQSQGMQLNKIAAMFSIPLDALAFLEDVNASQGSAEKLRRRLKSHVVIK